MVMHDDFKLPSRLGNAARHCNVGIARLRITRGMVVNEDDGCRPNFKRAPHDFTRIDWCFVDGANADHFLRKEMISAVQKQNPQLLRGGVRNCYMQIVMQRL